MNRSDEALFESIAAGMKVRPLPEAVRRSGDKITPGKNMAGLSTFTARSKGGKEEEGTAFKAKTADGKTVPIIMRGEAGKGGTAEVIVPGGKRIGLSIQQASKLRQNISIYDLSEVMSLIDAIKKGGKLPEHIDPTTDMELLEKAPPGWAGTVKAMKRHMPVEKAFALAWTGYKQGKEPHYKDDGQSTTSKGEPKKKKKFQNEATATELDEEFLSIGGIYVQTFSDEILYFKPSSRQKNGKLAGKMATAYPDSPNSKPKVKKISVDKTQYSLWKSAKDVPQKVKDALSEEIELREAAEVASVEIEQAFQLWLKKLRAAVKLRGARDVGYQKGEKYWKVFSMVGPMERTALHFFDPSNGDIYKAESWKKKAPRVRANVLKLNLSMGEGVDLAEEVDVLEEKDPKLKPGQQVTYKTLDMGNNERKGVGISRETGTETFTAVALSQSKGGFKTFQGAKKWLEKTTGKKLVGGIVESMDVPDQDDTEFLAVPGDIQKAIETKLGLSGMQGPQAVLKTISQMYSAGDVPAAVYAAASGMARAEQRLSVPLAQAMNQLDAATVAAAIAKGISGTSAPTIKNMEQWWMGEIGKLAGDRGGDQHTSNNVGPSNEPEVQPYIDSLATEAMDAAFEQAMGECELPIGSGALSGPEAIGRYAGYEEPIEVPGSDLATEMPINPGEAASAIQYGRPRSNETDRAQRHTLALPGENRIKPGQYTAEEFDALPFKQRLRMAEAYDRLVGDAPDMGQEEVVDGEAYKAMLQNRHSNPKGSTTPVVTPEGPSGAVVIDDVEELDAAFAAALASEDSQAA